MTELMSRQEWELQAAIERAQRKSTFRANVGSLLLLATPVCLGVVSADAISRMDWLSQIILWALIGFSGIPMALLYIFVSALHDRVLKVFNRSASA